MARSKKPIDPQKEAEMRELLSKFKQGFAEAIVELEMAKRKFSTAYVDAMLHQLEESIPKHVLCMNALDFLRTMDESQEMQKTPNQKQPFTSVVTATGVKINIPTIIKPRIGDGSVLQSRQPESDEVLFSVRGTPVFDFNNGADGDAVQNLRKRKMLEQLAQQSEAEMSPATKRIVNQLTNVLLSRTKKR